MKEFLEQNTEFEKVEEHATTLFKGKLIYYFFNIKGKEFVLSKNTATNLYVLSNEDGTTIYCMGEEAKLKTYIKALADYGVKVN